MSLITKAFIIIEVLIFIFAIFIFDFNVSMRYFAILCCYTYCMFQAKSKDTSLMCIAFIFTLISDLFLLVINDYFEVGVLFFIIVQGLYFYRLIIVNKLKYNLIYLIVFVILIFQIMFLILIKEYDLLVFLSIIYFTTLIFNVIISTKNYKINIYFALGLVLFLCCDIFVGLGNIDLYVNLPNFINKIINLNFDFQWFFYIPSQVLIALSINKNKHLY